MFFKKKIYLKTHKIHHKTLKVIYQSDAPDEDFFELSNSTFIHQRQLGFLLMKIYKSAVNANPESM